MALSTQRALPCLPCAESAPQWKYDVFLSFRGEDTRRGFTSHLYRELQYRQTIKTFKDDRELERGASISPELLSAIEQSHLAIVLLSPNYATSSWCLDELAKIVESMESRTNAILPVFFDVDATDVRHQRRNFAKAFAKHEEKYSDDINKVERWRAALTKVANLSGWDSKNFESEAELIKVIVKCVWRKVCPTIALSCSTAKLVGINFGLMELGSLLALEEKDIRFIGIWGMGGVGKTTLAKLVFERISHQFEVREFLVDVREVNAKYGTLVDLQKQFLSPILKENIAQVWDEQKGIFFIKKCMSNKKVLLVVDDVDCSDQLTNLCGNKSWFGEGSRIIVTTRDKRLLIENDIEISFEVIGLDNSDALELFSQNAFKKNWPEEGFLELSMCFVDYAKGLPLALKILGGSLYKRDLEAWNSALDKLKQIPHPTILQKLKISYDALDDMQKEIFLDVACLHKGMKKGRVIEMLDRSGFCGRIGIDVLIEKSLLTIEIYDNIGMHGLVQEMAWDIVCQESNGEIGRRSRLFHRDDIFHVFMKNMGIKNVESFDIVSCGSKISEWFNIQSEGDSLTVELPPPDLKSEWMGIIFCVVFADHKYNPTDLKGTDKSDIFCFSKGIDYHVWTNFSKLFKGDHVWVFYVSHSSIRKSVNDRIDVSFTTCYSGCWSTSMEWYGTKQCECENYGVKRCGARLLYEQDLKELLK